MKFLGFALCLLLPACICAEEAKTAGTGIVYATPELNGLFPEPAELLKDFYGYFKEVVPEERAAARFEIESSSDLPAGGMRAVRIAGKAGSASAQRLMVTAREGKRTHVLYDSGFFQQECGTPDYKAGAAFPGGKGKGRYLAFEVVRDAYDCCGADGEEKVDVYFVSPEDYTLITVAERSYRNYPDTSCAAKPSARVERESDLRLDGDFLHIRTTSSREGVTLPKRESSLRIRRSPAKK